MSKTKNGVEGGEATLEKHGVKHYQKMSDERNKKYHWGKYSDDPKIRARAIAKAKKKNDARRSK